MVPQISLLVLLVDLIDTIPSPAVERTRGRPPTDPDRLCLKALVIMLIRDVVTVDGLLAILAQPTPEMQALRARLTCDGRFPSRRTWERRVNALPATLPARIACLGTYLVAHLQPWADGGSAVAIDSTVLRAQGGVWHQKDRAAGDNVSIKGASLNGIVERIEGEGDDRRYILDVYGHGAGSAHRALRNASDAASAQTTYSIDEIEPAH